MAGLEFQNELLRDEFARVDETKKSVR